MYELAIVSSLTKVMPGERPRDNQNEKQFLVLKEEVFSFQYAYYYDGEEMANPHDIQLKIDSPLAGRLRFRDVIPMPARWVCPEKNDKDYISTLPGMYPDLLREKPHNRLLVLPGQWQSVWVELDARDFPIEPGSYKVRGILEDEQGNLLAEAFHTIRILRSALRKQEMIHTEWFHTDCLADYYQVPVWSEDHWEIIGNFFQCYGKRGMNMVLTPVLAPSLDVALGGSRTCAQLVEIESLGWGKYKFSFERLIRWIRLAKENGISYFEIAHLFTQWGAKYAPRVKGKREGKETWLFGWHTKAGDREYQLFLEQLLPALIQVCKEEGIDKQLYFHISDEPSKEDLESYVAARKQTGELLKGYPVMDALSSYEIYLTGAVECPIPATDHIKAFLDQGVSGLWTYYCCAQGEKVSNRFFSMPLWRTAILGVQLYTAGVEGFLHWGFNFYNTQYSLEKINPYEITDAGGRFPAGDSFLVYPGKGGIPEESIRLMAMEEAMQDVRALKMLEKKKGRAAVLTLIEELAGGRVTFTDYPKGIQFLLQLRQRVRAEIIES